MSGTWCDGGLAEQRGGKSGVRELLGAEGHWRARDYIVVVREERNGGRTALDMA